jgi:hypothetical protein
MTAPTNSHKRHPTIKRKKLSLHSLRRMNILQYRGAASKSGNSS